MLSDLSVLSDFILQLLKLMSTNKQTNTIHQSRSESVDSLIHSSSHLCCSSSRSGCDNFGDGNWDKFYTNEPTDLAPNTTPAQRKLLLGGETTM
jgi:hypothetical protein